MEILTHQWPWNNLFPLCNMGTNQLTSKFVFFFFLLRLFPSSWESSSSLFEFGNICSLFAKVTVMVQVCRLLLWLIFYAFVFSITLYCSSCFLFSWLPSCVYLSSPVPVSGIKSHTMALYTLKRYFCWTHLVVALVFVAVRCPWQFTWLNQIFHLSEITCCLMKTVENCPYKNISSTSLGMWYKRPHNSDTIAKDFDNSPMFNII